MISAKLSGPNVKQLVNPSTGVTVDVMSSRGMVFSCWTPSPEEIELLSNGKPLWLIQKGSHIPEMCLVVGDQSFIVPSEQRMTASSDEALVHDILRERETNQRWGTRIAWATVVGVIILVMGLISVIVQALL